MPQHVLIADANPVHRELHGDVLIHAGYHTTEVGTIEELLAYLRNRPCPDLLLLGLHWQSSYDLGLQTYRTLRLEYPRLKILVASTMDPAFLEEALGAAVEYLGKPFDGEALLSAVRQMWHTGG